MYVVFSVKDKSTIVRTRTYTEKSLLLSLFKGGGVVYLMEKKTIKMEYRVLISMQNNEWVSNKKYLKKMGDPGVVAGCVKMRYFLKQDNCGCIIYSGSCHAINQLVFTTAL